ncbi:MAG: alpha/beta fold hydrolase [Polyangiaceae bacterium]|nr:alpha/beta hydrolase [Polyangiaceae bacterium]NUQ78425.1 alpha/beta fold hydrolase [Polyangiaceae bacterium]
MQIARIGDIDIHYKTYGSGPPVLLIMGLGGRGDAWQPMAEALAARGRTAIHFDNRDVGWSSLVENTAYEVADMAADALGLLDHLGIAEADILGISMGGIITQEILVRAPGRVRRAVLLATTPGGPNAVHPASEVAALLLQRAQGDPVTLLRKVYEGITAPGFAARSPHLIDQAVEVALKKPTLPAAMMRQLSAVMRWSSWDRLPEVKTPTLVVHGDADPLVPHMNGANIAQRIPGAKLVTLPGVGHLVPLEAPEPLFQAVTEFFDG